MALSPPVGGRTDRLLPARLAFLAGAVVGALASATVLWALSGLGRALPSAVSAALFGGAVALLLADRALDLELPLPQARRQIPRPALAGPGWAGPARFGLALGSGVRTYVSSPAAYVPALAVLLLGPTLPEALALGVGFGLARGLLPMARARAPKPSDWDEANARRAEGGAIPALLATAALAAWSLAVVT